MKLSRVLVFMCLAHVLPVTLLAQEQPPPPSINRVNEHLPSWLQVRGEFRERMEGFSSAGFTDDRDDLFWLSRFRFDVTVRPSARVLFTVQGQDARVGGKAIGATTAPFSGPLDLRMAYMQAGGLLGGTTQVRFGRQELVFGEQRLVGHVSWLNTARTFDGARVTVRRGPLQVDGFATSVVRSLRGELDKSGNGNGFFGLHLAATGAVPQGAVEPYVFWRGDRNLTSETGANGDLGVATVGVRLAGRFTPTLDYGIEMAVQRGSLADDEVSAWAGHWQLRSVLPGAKALRVVGEYNYASGDRNPADGRRGTFDQLYPTAHDKYGLADQVGWRNIHHARVGLDIHRWSGWPITVGHHTWWLAEAADALYNAGGASIARVAGGAANRRVGQEFDVQVARMVTPQLQVAAGYSHIFPGPFLEEATAGASYSAPFVMATYVFLADK